MMRSLFSGVAGLKTHQTGMDVIGANISNVNTPGYKGSRSTFSDVISQTMQGAAASTGNRGGTNPIQVGLGVGLAAVDTIMTSGSYQPTGKQTDLAIQNEGFFIVSDGLNQYYTRAGNFDFDGVGNFTIPGTGLKVKGWVGTDGVVDTTGQVKDIVIPAGITVPASATTKLTFINNLSGSDTPGATAQTSKDVYDSLGKTHTLMDKFVKIDDVNNVWLSKASLTDANTTVANSLTEISFDSAGKIGTVKQITPVNAVPSTAITIASGLQLDSATGATRTSNAFSLVDTNGVSHNYQLQFVTTAGPAFAVNVIPEGGGASVGTGTVTWNAATSTYTIPALTITNTTPNLSILTSDVAGLAPASGKFTGTVTGSATTGLTIPSIQLDNTSGSVHDAYYTVFDKNLSPHVLKMEFTQTADKTWSYKLTEAGVTNATTLISGTATYAAATGYTFAPTLASSSFSIGSGAAAQTVTIADPLLANAIAPAGNAFLADCAKTYAKSSTVSPVEFTPAGASKVSITMDVSALTQYGGDTTVQASTQNGNAAGALDTVTVDNSGKIVGKFSNGTSRDLAQVALAIFTNPGGLTRIGSTLFSESNNSGSAAIGTSGSGGRGTIAPGTLEMSNIDLADQFSKMITTQRGFQSNSKIITVSDEMLEILANLKR